MHRVEQVGGVQEQLALSFLDGFFHAQVEGETAVHPALRDEVGGEVGRRNLHFEGFWQVKQPVQFQVAGGGCLLAGGIGGRHGVLVRDRVGVDGVAVEVAAEGIAEPFGGALLENHLHARVVAAPGILKNIVEQQAAGHLRGDAGYRGVNGAVVGGGVEAAFFQRGLVAEFKGGGELRFQGRVAHFYQFRLVVFREDADVHLAGSVHPAVEEKRQLVAVIYFIGKTDIRERLQIIIAVAFIGVVVGIDLVIHFHIFLSDTAFQFKHFRLKHIIAVECRYGFVIICPTASFNINGRIKSRKKLHIDWN